MFRFASHCFELPVIWLVIVRNLGRRVRLHFLFLDSMFVLHFFIWVWFWDPRTRLLFVNTRKKNYDSSDSNDVLWWVLLLSSHTFGFTLEVYQRAWLIRWASTQPVKSSENHPSTRDVCWTSIQSFFLKNIQVWGNVTKKVWILIAKIW